LTVLSLFYLLKLTSITNRDMILKIPLAVGDVSICWEDLRRLTLSECRQKLRKLEVGMIEYREALEERGLKNHEEIEKRVALQRKKLEAECGLVEAIALPSRDRDSKGPDSGLDRGNSGASGNYRTLHISISYCSKEIYL
jgi:hypothetical protein